MAEPYRRLTNGGTESLLYAVCQIPAKSDEDRFCCTLSDNSDHSLSMSSFGVFDGHGGHRASSKCAAELHDEIISTLFEIQPAAKTKNSIKSESLDQAFCLAANEASVKLDSQIKLDSTAGTTAVSLFVLHLDDGYSRVLCPWIGDSRCVCYSVDINGQLSILPMSEDHKPGLEREYVRIQNKESFAFQSVPIEIKFDSFKEKSDDGQEERKEAEENDTISSRNQIVPTIDVELTPPPTVNNDTEFGHPDVMSENSIHQLTPQRSFIARRTLPNDVKASGPVAVFGCHGYSLTMTRSIGDSRGARSCIAQPDISALLIPPTKHMRFVLATDGMWDVLTNEIVGKICFQQKDPKKAALKLANAAWLRRIHHCLHMDDITVCVVDINFDKFPVTSLSTAVGCSCSVS